MSAPKTHAIIRPNKTGLHLTNRFLAEHLNLDASDHVLLLFNQENSSITLQAFNPLSTQGHYTAPVQKAESSDIRQSKTYTNVRSSLWKNCQNPLM